MSSTPTHTTIFAFVLGLLLLASATFAADAPAQPPRQRPPATGGAGGPGAGGPGAGMLLERAQEFLGELGLSAEQKSRVDQILAEARKDLQQMRSELANLAPQDRMRQLGPFLDGVRMDLKAVLSPEQKAAFDQRVEQARQQLRQRLGGAGASTRPATTRPLSPPAGAGPGGGPAMIERLRQNLAQLDLSDEQKTKLKSLFDDLKSQADALRAKAQAGDQAAREQVRELLRKTREQLLSILTPEQARRLRELMGPPGEAPPREKAPPPDRDPTRPPAEKAGADSQMQMMDEMKPVEKAGARDAVADEPLPAGPSPGDAAPDLSLRKLDGSLVQLSGLKGRVVVLVFGSYTSPAFRQRIAALEKLENDTAGKAQFYVVYTREAHAQGQWEVERNKSEQISLKQPSDAEERAQAARTARQALDITIPVVLDTMDDQARKSYGADANSAYVIGRDGTVVARQQWFEPAALERGIEKAIASPTATGPG